MANTIHAKLEFGRIAHSFSKENQQSTRGVKQERTETIKITQKGMGENTFCGYRKVNYADQKAKEAYRKINKMLGGN